MRSFIVFVGSENDKMSKTGEGERRVYCLSSILPLMFMMLLYFTPTEKIKPVLSTNRDHHNADPYSSL